MLLDAALLNTHHYKVRIKGKVKQPEEWFSAPLHLGVVAIEKGANGSPSTWVTNLVIGLMNRLFVNDPGDRDSIPARVIPKTKKMVLDATLLKAQHYKVRIKGKIAQSREWSGALPYTSV